MQETDLKTLEALDDFALWHVAAQKLPGTHQNLYNQLVEKDRRGQITALEKQAMTYISDKARRLTMMRSHAYTLLKWRGYEL